MAYQTIYPYTNEVLHTFDNMTDQGLADVLERAHLLYKKWRKEDHLEERKAQLHQVA
ncbi:TPA: NAD-dependent succinate-semialdehyde dehydrogenase, partial [Streptococcus pyogenes]